jgi:ABC-type transporter Mla subunit MlaD
MCISRQRQDQIVFASSHLQELQPNLDKVLKDVKVVMGTHLEEYADLKQSLSTYLPQHLLTANPVPQGIDR